jgi:transposase
MDELTTQLFPSNYQVTLTRDDSRGYEFELQSRSRSAVCPYCGEESTHFHGFRERIARDLPISGKSVKLSLGSTSAANSGKTASATCTIICNRLNLPLSAFSS